MESPQYRERFRDGRNPAASAARGYSLVPVSYTHLDVYKRQHLTREGVVASIVEYGYLRLSVGAYNNHGDIDRILRATRGLAA